MALKQKTKVDVYQMVTDRIVAAIDSGDTEKWNMPWITYGVPDQNPVSGTVYSGVNTLLTWASRMSQGFSSCYWMTYKQAKELAVRAAKAEGREIIETKRGKYTSYTEIVDGETVKFSGGVRKDEKATIIVFWKILKDKNDPEKTFALLRYFSVFNAEQIDGISSMLPEPSEKGNGFDPIADCETIVNGWDHTPIHYGGDRAFYSILSDEITLPTREQFKSAEGFYSTAFHEMGHATGSKSRLNRDFGNTFGSDPYAREELVAELTAAFVCAHVGINNEDSNAAYLKHWRDKIAADPKLIVSAAGKAQKAADFILGIDRVFSSDDDNEEDS